ncbi:GDP-L-fucose synthase [Flavobacteriaceae bacterium F08102]|nr:GDP-L-fucose synthase [Flavobacteriaceae bacterium F08102]
MKKDSKIFIAGHKGMVGSAIWRGLEADGYTNLIGRRSSELDLTDGVAVNKFFENEKPNYVYLAAAKVGGIVANNTYRAQFIYENIQIQNNVIHASYLHNVEKLLFLGSSCIYPKNAPQPLKEEYLLTGELEYTNEPYAIAKIAGIKMCEAYNLQYGTNFIAVMPTNLYGENDNYDLEKSHVLPALIRKMHLGKALMNNDWDAIRQDFNKNPIEGVDGNSDERILLEKLEAYGIKKDSSVTITLWGSGNPRREFLHADDLADASNYIMKNVDFSQVASGKQEVRNTHINIGCGMDLSIKELAYLVQEIVGYTGTIEWDHSKPDGTFQKLLDVSKLKDLNWSPKIALKNGLIDVYNNYVV